MAEAQIVTGAFVNVASTPFFVPVHCQIDEFRLVNLTRAGITALGVAGNLQSDKILEAEFFPRYMSAGTAWVKQSGTIAGILQPYQSGYAAIGGFSLFDAANQQLGAKIAIASFVPGQPTVFTASAPHGLVVGDNVLIDHMTSAKELGGLVMTVTAIGGGGTTFTTLLDSTNSLTSVGFVRKVGNAYLSQPSLYYPQWRAIAKITLANPMVVTLLVRQVYQIGDKVRFNIPSVFGMQQLNSGNNGLPKEFTVIAVNNAVGTQSITLDVDSSAFTAFAWPAAASYPFSLPVVIPQGEGNLNNDAFFGVVPSPLPYGNQNILGFATQNQAENGILIGAGDGTNSASTGGLIGSAVEAWEWRAICSSETHP